MKFGRGLVRPPSLSCGEYGRFRFAPGVEVVSGRWRARPPSPEGGEYGRCLPAPVVVGRVETVFFAKLVFFAESGFFLLVVFFCFRESWDRWGMLGSGPLRLGSFRSFLLGFFLKGEVVSLLRHLLEIRLFWENSNGGECFVLRTVSLYH